MNLDLKRSDWRGDRDYSDDSRIVKLLDHIAKVNSASNLAELKSAIVFLLEREIEGIIIDHETDLDAHGF